MATAPRRPSVWWARLCGLIAGGTGLAIADLAAGLLSPQRSPLTAVGELIISVLPASLIEFGKTTLGTADKPILLGIIAAAVVIIAAFAGQLEHRTKRAGAVIFAVLAVIGIVGVASLSYRSASGFLPTIIGLAAGYGILRMLLTRLDRWYPQLAQDQQTANLPARRSFIGLTILVGAAAVVVTIGGRALTGAANAVATARDNLKLPLPKTPAPPVPAGAELNIPELTTYVSPNDNFYRIDTALQVPSVNPDT